MALGLTLNGLTAEEALAALVIVVRVFESEVEVDESKSKSKSVFSNPVGMDK